MLHFHFFQPALQLLQALLQQAAVGFQLGFARAAQADRAAALALQVGPAADQARGHVLQLGQLDLQLAFVAAGALGEDFQNQQRAVVDRQADGALQIALLHRAQRLVEQHLLRTLSLGQQADFLCLSAADEQGRIGGLALAGQARDRLHPGSFGQLAEFFQVMVKMRRAEIHAHQDGGGAFRVDSRGQIGEVVRWFFATF